MAKIESKLILGLARTHLNADERRWFASHPPAGVILFARNIDTPNQVRALLNEARSAAGTELWAAIDEEGGRVNRIPWLPFANRPAAAHFAQAGEQMAQEDGRRCGEALAALGFSHNCAPVLDLFHPNADPVIGQRAYSSDPARVSALATAVMAGLQAGGVEAVGKHFPGHGRAGCDSHLATPTIDADNATLIAEAAPFADLVRAEIGHIMTAHICYPQQDGAIASHSQYWLQKVLRQQFGFQGFIWSDDLSMGGAGEDLAATIAAANHAGCDRLLVCQPEDCAKIYDGSVEFAGF